jgi:hypothetical protein
MLIKELPIPPRRMVTEDLEVVELLAVRKMTRAEVLASIVCAVEDLKEEEFADTKALEGHMSDLFDLMGRWMSLWSSNNRNWEVPEDGTVELTPLGLAMAREMQERRGL